MAWFAARVELDVRLPDEGPSDVMIERLARWNAAVGRSPAGRLDTQLSIEAESIRHATEIAQLVVLDAARAAGYGDVAPVLIEVMTEAEFERQQAAPPVPELVDAGQASKILGVTRQRVVQLADRLGGIKIGNSFAFPRATVERRAADRQPLP